MSELYTIERDGKDIGVVMDRELAEQIDGMEIDNGASDPAYREVMKYTVPDL